MFQQVLYILRDPLYGSYTGADWIVFCVIVITSALLGRWSCSSCSSKYKDFATHTQPELLSRARQTPASDHSPFPYDKRFLQWDQRIRMERDNPRRKVMYGAGGGAVRFIDISIHRTGDRFC